jgi:hypothetical protein
MWGVSFVTFAKVSQPLLSAGSRADILLLVPIAAAGGAVGICAIFGGEADGARGAGNGPLVGLLIASVALISSPNIRHVQYRTHRVQIYQTQVAGS